MRTYLIDTNGYLRLFVNDIPDQTKQVETLLTAAKTGKAAIFLPHIVVFEIIFALQKFYHWPKTEVVSIVKTLVTTEYIEMETREIFLSALEHYEKSSVSFVDSYLFITAQSRTAELFTFDKKLRKQKKL